MAEAFRLTANQEAGPGETELDKAVICRIEFRCPVRVGAHVVSLRRGYRRHVRCDAPIADVANKAYPGMHAATSSSGIEAIAEGACLPWQNA